MTQAGNVTLMNSARVERTMRRMAHQIIERAKGSSGILLVGIDERGYTTARLLEKYLSESCPQEVTACNLVLKNRGKGLEADLKQIDDNTYLIIVDDVIFSGRTMFRALKTVMEHFSCEEVHTAVLVDRGHRRFPMEAEFVGIHSPSKLNEHVSVVIDDENISRVVLEKNG